jgi:hypothetical protein
MQGYFENLVVAQLVYKLSLFYGTEASFYVHQRPLQVCLGGTSREPNEVVIKWRQ